MINVGESSGNLEQVFLQMAYYMERDEETRKRIKSATRYPYVCDDRTGYCYYGC